MAEGKENDSHIIIKQYDRLSVVSLASLARSCRESNKNEITRNDADNIDVRAYVPGERNERA